MRIFTPPVQQIESQLLLQAAKLNQISIPKMPHNLNQHSSKTSMARTLGSVKYSGNINILKHAFSVNTAKMDEIMPVIRPFMTPAPKELASQDDQTD